MNLNEMFQQAVTHHQAGRFAEAEELYLSVLQAEPKHPDANHNLGLMAMQLNQAEKGLPYLQAAWGTDPSIEQYWLTLTECLLEMGHFEDALLLIEDATRRGMDLPQAQQLLMRAKGGTDTRTQPAEAVAEKVEALAGSSEEPSGSEPGSQEINILVTLFTGGRYTEAITLAQAMTVRFPAHGFGWKVLGAVFKQMGRNADALEPMQKAAALSPNDTEAHCNLGATLQDMGRLNEAEGSFRRALEIKPDYAGAYNNLGNILQNTGRLDEAEASYRRALEIKPDYAEVHNNLGNALQDMGRPNEAEASFRRALQIKPDYAEAHNSLGNTLQNTGRLDEAEASYRRALEIKPDYAEAHNNMGNTLQNAGRLDEAEASYRRALQIKPDLAEALYNLGHTLCDLDDLGQASAVYQKVLDIEPDNRGLDAAVYLAILHYLGGNHEQCRSKLIASQPIMAKAGFKHKNVRTYWHYLDQLLSWLQQSNQKNNQTQGMGALYVIGESHSLTAHRVVVRYNGQEMRCAAEWISGCKQWHLGNGKANKYKHKFEAVMARLPRESAILLSIGEIDCRHDEGIVKAWRKYPDKTVAEIVQSTVEAYISYVAAIGGRYGHRIIVGGVPATNISLDTLTATEAEQLVHLIRIFNTALKNLALDSGMGFLDVYALTDRGDGIASGEWHIDGIHLLPSAVVEAFDRYCTVHQ